LIQFDSQLSEYQLGDKMMHLCLQFRIPRSAEATLPGFLKELEAKKEELGITDIQISLTSLEEVFLTIAREVGCPQGSRPINIDGPLSD